MLRVWFLSFISILCLKRQSETLQTAAAGVSLLSTQQFRHETLDFSHDGKNFDLSFFLYV